MFIKNERKIIYRDGKIAITENNGKYYVYYIPTFFDEFIIGIYKELDTETIISQIEPIKNFCDMVYARAFELGKKDGEITKETEIKTQIKNWLGIEQKNEVDYDED